MAQSPLRVALLCSRRAPGLEELLRAQRRRPAGFRIVCVFSSEEACTSETAARAAGIPFLSRPIRAFYHGRRAPLTDLRVRRDYDASTAAMLSRYRADLLLLSSYLYILTEPVLASFPERIFNVHHSDLTLRDAEGRPRYTGLRSVRDAIMGGESETRATLHLVTSKLDEGPLILRSWAFPVSPLAHDARRWGSMDVLKAYAFAHQEWMLGSAWAPLFKYAMELLAAQRISFSNQRAWIDGLSGPVDLPDPRPWHPSLAPEILERRLRDPLVALR